jgi:glycosyltransferase involved in cell wall biosynthesis
MSSPLTFRVVFYNHAPYAEQCVRSVLAQECPPLQVVFSDDCSTDTTWDIIRRTVDNYKGPHEITLNRNPENLGISDHLNAIWPLRS